MLRYKIEIGVYLKNKNMKKILFYIIAIYLVSTQTLSAQQWSPITNNNIWNLNSGNVGIGCDPGGATFKIYKAELPIFQLASATSRLEIGVATCSGCFASGAGIGDVVFRSLGGSQNLIFSMPNNNNDGKTYIGFNDVANLTWLKIFNNKVMRVNGTVIATKMMVKTDVWADYVFDKNYKLNSLDEIDSYIKINKHLPDVPSANEVIEKGIDIAQMNTLLLKKVEELTLLMIEQHKTISALQNKVNEMQK